MFTRICIASDDKSLLAGLPPGCEFREGKGLAKGAWAVFLDGKAIWNYEATKEKAAQEAKQRLDNLKWSQDRKNDNDFRVKEIIRRGEFNDNDLKTLGLKPSSDLRWFIPKAAEIFGLRSRDVRPVIKDLIKIAHTDGGSKIEYVNAKKALEALRR